MEKEIYIHYGSKGFDQNLFKERRYMLSNKPDQGLWASKINDEFGWRKWCEKRKYELDLLKQSFKFTISENAKIMQIKGVEVSDELKHYINNGAIGTYLFGLYISREGDQKMIDQKMIDFDRMIKDGYDGIEFTITETPFWNNETDTRNILWDMMYGWDCNSIVIFNPDIIEEIDK